MNVKKIRQVSIDYIKKKDYNTIKDIYSYPKYVRQSTDFCIILIIFKINEELKL